MALMAPVLIGVNLAENAGGPASVGLPFFPMGGLLKVGGGGSSLEA